MKYPIIKIDIANKVNDDWKSYFIKDIYTINDEQHDPTLESGDVKICLVLPLVTKSEPRWIGYTKDLVQGSVVDSNTTIYVTPFPENFIYSEALSQNLFEDINKTFFECIDNANKN